MTLGGMCDLNPSEHPIQRANASGYDLPELWLSDGWNVVQTRKWHAPLYWEREDCWLPRESTWEAVASAQSPPIKGNFLEQCRFRPLPLSPAFSLNQPAQMFGDVWEWTCSPYSPYPGYRAAEGAIGEYNGKFMCNQMVLRGGSYGTPRSHIRATYRNFFPPDVRWPFTGIRVTKESA